MLLPRPAPRLLAEMPLAFQQVAAALARVARAAAPQHADFAHTRNHDSDNNKVHGNADVN